MENRATFFGASIWVIAGILKFLGGAFFEAVQSFIAQRFSMDSWIGHLWKWGESKMLTLSPFWNGLLDGIFLGSFMAWFFFSIGKFLNERDKKLRPFKINFDPKNKDGLFWHGSNMPSPDSNSCLHVEYEYYKDYFLEIENRTDWILNNVECWIIDSRHRSQQKEFVRSKAKRRTFNKGDIDYIHIFTYNDFDEIRLHDSDPEEYQFVRDYIIEVRAENARTCTKKITINVNKKVPVSVFP